MTIPEDRYRNMYFFPGYGGAFNSEILDLRRSPEELATVAIRELEMEPAFSVTLRVNRGPCYMPDLSGINPDLQTIHGARRDRRQLRTPVIGEWYARPVRESDRIGPPSGLEAAIEQSYVGAIRNEFRSYMMEAMQRRLLASLLSGPMYERELLFERELRRRVMGERFRQAFMGRRLAEMREAYYQPIGIDYAQMEINAYLNMFPHFEDEEQAREWFESMGAVWPEEGPNPWSHTTVSKNLKSQAKTLRERAFARIFQGLTSNGAVKLYCVKWEGNKAYEADLKGKGLRNVMAAMRRDPEARRHLATLPISAPPIASNANEELVDPLQDLADIIVHEITLAYEEEYYPRPVGVAALTDEHVVQVMQAMQREIDRESRSMRQAKLEEDLPWERQVALAERRRNWFAKFGITPKSWRTGRWSLWKVPNKPFPEGYSGHNRENASDIANDVDEGQGEGITIGPVGPNPPDWVIERAYTMSNRALPAPGQVDTVIIDDPFGGGPFPTISAVLENDEPRMLRNLGTIFGIPVVIDETEND